MNCESTRSKVAAYLVRHAGHHSSGEIAKGLGVPIGRVNNALTELAMNGEIQRIGQNTATRYAAAEPFVDLPKPRRRVGIRLVNCIGLRLTA